MDMRISQRKNLRPYPCFQGHIKIKTANLGQNYLNADYLQIGSADFSQIRIYMYITNLIFKVTLENEAAIFKPKYLNTHYLCSGSAEFSQTCMILKSTDPV